MLPSRPAPDSTAWRSSETVMRLEAVSSAWPKEACSAAASADCTAVVSAVASSAASSPRLPPCRALFKVGTTLLCSSAAICAATSSLAVAVATVDSGTAG